MDLWTSLRLLKFVGLALFAAGIALATLVPARATRAGAAWVLAPLGFFVSWVAGYGLLKASGGSMGAPWVSGGMLTSLLALHGALLAAKPADPARWRTVLAWAGLGAAVGAMVGRSGGAALGIATALGAALAGVAGALLHPRADEGARPAQAVVPEGAPGAVPEGFWLWARLEALSAGVLFLVYMPLKYGAGVNLDNGTGTVGWIHGVLTILFLHGLFPAARAGRWDWRTTALAFGAALVPLGGFVFERRFRR